MTCADIELELSLYAAGALEGAERSAFETHLSACAACRASVERARALLNSAELPPLSLKDQAQLSQLSRAPSRRPSVLPRFAALAAGLVAVLLAGKLLAPRPHLPARVSRPAPIAAPLASADDSVPELRFDDDATSSDELAYDDSVDSALYDAVVFEGGEFPYDVDNG